LKIDRGKLEMLMANACMSVTDLITVAEMPRGTYCRAVYGGKPVTTKTAGKLARALGVNVADILEVNEGESD
jgi:DNA-binding Xre family transcriptional regulator